MTIMTLRVRASIMTVVGLLLGGCQTAGTSSGAGPASQAPPSVAPAPNGVEKLTAEQMLGRSRTALQSASSFQFRGYQKIGKSPIFAEYQMVGGNLSGTIRIRIDEVTMEEVTAEFMSVDGRQYLKPDEEYWDILVEEDPDSARRVAAGRWIIRSVTKNGIAALFSIDSLVRTLAMFETPYKGAPSEVDGLPVFTMGDRDSSATVLVATAGEPYPVDWSTAGGLATLTKIGAPAPEIQAPPAGDVIDALELVRAGAAVGV